MNIAISLLVIAWVGTLVFKRYKAQAVLFLGGITLLVIAHIAGYGTILPPKQATGNFFFDIFELIRDLFSNRAAKLGLNIMAVAGFARYMDHIGASRALVHLAIRPLRGLKSPYIVLSAC